MRAAKWQGACVQAWTRTYAAAAAPDAAAAPIGGGELGLGAAAAAAAVAGAVIFDTIPGAIENINENLFNAIIICTPFCEHQMRSGK